MSIGAEWNIKYFFVWKFCLIFLLVQHTLALSFNVSSQSSVFHPTWLALFLRDLGAVQVFEKLPSFSERYVLCKTWIWLSTESGTHAYQLACMPVQLKQHRHSVISLTDLSAIDVCPSPVGRYSYAFRHYLIASIFLGYASICPLTGIVNLIDFGGRLYYCTFHPMVKRGYVH